MWKKSISLVLALVMLFSCIPFQAFATEFEELLRQKLDELFDLNTPFKCCPEQESDKICAYCDFKTICKR